MSKARSSFVLCAIAVATVFAQDAVPPADDSSTAQAERVLVTGSYIPTQTAAEVGANPVEVIDRYTIEKSGERNTEELLRNLSVANANGVPASGNSGNITNGEGAASIALRGLDPGATLVLIDGHRVAPFPSGTNFGTETFVDLNTIPRAAIDSIEILKDGASTAYGADAIAGVVNIKLRRDYRGTELKVEYGNTLHTDSGEKASSIVFGLGNDSTNVSGVVNYYSRNSILSRDRGFDRETPAVRASTNASPFNLEVNRAAAEAAAGRPITEVDPALDTFFAHAPFFSNGTAPASDYTFTEGRSVFFPINNYSTDVPSTERYGAVINADHKIFDDQLVAYGDVFFERADVEYSFAPANTFDFAEPGQSTLVPPLAIPPHAPGATVGGPSYADVGLSLDAYNPFNPFQQIISGASRARLVEFGPRVFDHENDVFFTTAGIRGDNLFDGSWGYDAAARYSRSDVTSTIRTVSSSRFQRILNAADPIFDPSSPQFIGTTVPYNPFGDYRVPIANNYRFTDFVVIHPQEDDHSTLTTFDLNIYSTRLFDLPAGPVGIAFGAQFLHETLEQNPDATLRIGDELGVGGAFFPVRGSRESYAGYAETSIPIFGDEFAALGAHALELTAAVRFEAFDNGSNVTVPKFGLRYQPFDDSLTIRATWGEGFKQPTLVDLYAPPAFGPQDIFDPVKQEFVPEVPTHFLANPNLQPEDSRNFSAGVVYSPKFARGLTLTVDLFDIETTGWINPNPDPTRNIQRIESGNVFPGEFVRRDAAGHVVELSEVSFENTGTKKVRGADFGVVWQVPTSLGTFRSSTQVTWLDSFQFSPLPGEKEQELRSSPTDPFSDDAYLAWKGNSRLDWIWRGFDAGITSHYLNGFHEFDSNGNEHWVRQTWLFDLQASYDFGTRSWPGWPSHFNNGWPKWSCLLDGAKVTVGCNNVFDQDPPRSVDNFPRFIYDPTGRFVYLSVTKKF